MDEELRYPEWRIGTSWVVDFRQRASWVMSSEVPWVGPFRMQFRVVGEDRDRYVLETTFSDQPKTIPQIRFEAWINKRDFLFVKGTIFEGEDEIPMGHDFMATLLIDHPPGVDMRGEQVEEHIQREPEHPISVRAFHIETPTGGIRVSSTELPYHLRIREEDYTLDLIDWTK